MGTDVQNEIHGFTLALKIYHSSVSSLIHHLKEEDSWTNKNYEKKKGKRSIDMRFKVGPRMSDMPTSHSQVTYPLNYRGNISQSSQYLSYH